MKQMKRIVNTLLCFFCAMTLVACQDKEAKIVYQKGEEEEKTEISFLTTGFDGDNLNIFDPIIRNFQDQNPKLKISFENYIDKNKTFAEFIKNRIDNSETTDIVCMDVVNIYEYANMQKIIDLSQTEMAKNLNDIARKDSSVHGKVMSLPTGLTAYCLGVNMDMLKACDLELPTNWAEFMHCCKILKSKGYQPIIGTKNFPKMFIIAGGLSQIYFNGDEDKNISQLNSGQTKISTYAKRGFEMLNDLVSNDYINAEEALKHNPSESFDLFKNEQGCFTIGNSVSYKENEVDFKFQLLPFPIDNGSISLMACDRRMTVMSDSKHQDECLRFLGYLTDKDAQATSLSSFGRLPAYQTESKIVDKKMFSVMESLEKNQVMLIQDYTLVFEQWGNLNRLANEFLENHNIQKQLDAFDKIQTDAIKKSQ